MAQTFVGMRVALFANLIAAVGLLTGCGFFSSGASTETANSATEDPNQTISITTAKSEAREMQAVISATGGLVADESSNIASRIAGKVANINVNVGDFINQGAVIAQIDDREPKLNLAEAEANVNQAIAAVRQAEARLGLTPNGKFNASSIPEVRAANANYEAAMAELRQAEANEKRYRELVETGDVASITYEGFRTTRDTARAQVENTKEQLGTAINTARQNNQAIKSAEAAVVAARTQVDTARQQVADTIIRAPFSGYISERPTAVGEFVTSASVIATILRTNPIRANLQISEADVPNVDLGAGVSIAVDAYKDRNFSGIVISVNPAVEVTSRSAIVEVSIQNPDNSLRTGMFVTGKINRKGTGQGIFIPKTAVNFDQSTQSYNAYVIVEGVAKHRVLQLGAEEGEFYQILSGIEADETVATSNLEQLFEGAKVAF